MRKGISNLKKLNTKAFTLIEMIAIIVIIGIIMLIAVPSVVEFINNISESSYKTYEYSMEEAAKNRILECISTDDETCYIPEENHQQLIFLSELIDKGFIENLTSADTHQTCDISQSYVSITNLGDDNFDFNACLYCGDYTTEDKSCTVFIDDGEPPICVYDNIEGASTEWTNQSRTVSIYCQDSGNGCVMNPFSKKFNSTTKYGEIIIKDRGGQETVCGRDPRNRINVFVDKTLPTCQLQINGTKVKMGYLPDNLSVDLARYEDMDSGILTYGIGTSIEEKLYNKEVSYRPNAGITTVIGYVKDVAGNEGVCYTSVKTVAPAPKFDLRYGYLLYPKEKYTLSGLEKNGSIFKTTNTTPKIKFKDMSKYTNVESIRITLNSNITKNETATARIKLVNGSTITRTGLMTERKNIVEINFASPITPEEIEIQFGTTVNIQYDIQKIEVIIADGDIPTNQPVTVYAFPIDVGVATVRYSFDNELTWQEANNSTYGSNTSGLVSTENLEGTRSAKSLFNIELIDLVPPVVTITRLNYHSFEYTVSDAFSGLAGYQITESETEPDTWEKTNYKQETIEVTGRKTYYIWGIDRAGNVSMKRISNHALTISVGTGTTLVIRENDENGPIIPSGTLVLYGTRLYLDGNSLAGYYGLVLKNGTRTVTNRTTTSVAGETRISSTARVCTQGTYSGEGQLYCTECSETTPGYNNSPVQSTTIDACYLSTEPGKYVSDEGEGQVTCAKDNFCAGGAIINYGSSTGGVVTGGIQLCSAGADPIYEYSDPGAESNEMCYYLTNPRYYIEEPYGDEVICPRDNYCPGNLRVYYGSTGGITRCPNGYRLTDDVGTSNAELCYTNLRDGQYVREAYEAPRDCDVGYYCPQRADGGSGLGDKIYFGEVSYNKYQCPADYPTTEGTGKSKIDQCAVHITGGVYVIDTHANTAICPKNQYCEDQYILYLQTGGNEPCPADYPTTDSTGASSKSACYTYSTLGTYAHNCQPLEPCAEGNYCVGGEKVYCGNTGGLTKCPGVYTHTDGTGKTLISQCYVDTSPGTYIANDYDLNQTTCPAGYYCPTAKLYYGQHNTYKSCTADTTVYTQSRAGSDEMSDCYLTTNDGQYIETANSKTISNCEAGYYCPSTDVHYGETGNRLSCATTAGIYTSSPAGSGSISACNVTVPAGKYITSEGVIATCPINNYCTGGTFSYGQTGNISNCASTTGVYTYSPAGSTSIEACYVNVLEGYYITATGENRAITTCTPGYYCPGATLNYPNNGGNVSCTTETTIYTQSNSFSKAVTDCYLNTENGTYIAHARDRFLTNCEAGYFCPVTRINYGETGTRASCFTDGGIFVNSDGNAQSLADCYVNVPPGKYVDNYGLIVNCPANYYCEGGKIYYGHTGKVESCRAKTGAYEYSPAGSDSIDDCYITLPAGYYINENHRVADCPAGYYCPGGTFTSEQTGGNVSCAEKTSIYTLSPTKSTSVSNCYLNTEPGTYIKNNNDTTATTCEANYYCPSTPVNYGSNGGRNSCLVNAGIFDRSPAGSGSILDCYTTAPAGKYVTPSGILASCTAGTYCEGGTYNYGSSGGIKYCSAEAGIYSQSPAESTSINACYVTVVDGAYITEEKTINQCEPGYYCVGATYHLNETGGRTSCSSTAGIYNQSNAGSNGNEDCYVNTTPGSYIASSYDQVQTTCEANYYCASTAVYYGTSGGRRSCLSDAGVYAYSPVGSSSINDCYTDVPRSKYVNVYNLIASCISGNYCPGGTFNYGQIGGIENCAANTGAYSQSPVESYEISQCYAVVSPGNYIDSNHVLSTCLEGYYCEGGTYAYLETGGLSSCASATGIYTLSAPGSKYSGDCYLTTTAGTYIRTNYDRSIATCGDGYYCPASNIKYGFNGNRQSCPVGYSHSNANPGSYNDCYYTTQMYVTKTQQTCEKQLITKEEVRNQCIITGYNTSTLTGQEAISNSCSYLNNTNKNGGVLSDCYLFGSSCTCTLTTPVYDWGDDIVNENVPDCTPGQSFTCSASTEGQYRKICRDVYDYEFGTATESTVLEGACQENVFTCGAGRDNQVKTECLDNSYRCVNGGSLSGDKCYYQ